MLAISMSSAVRTLLSAMYAFIAVLYFVAAVHACRSTRALSTVLPVMLSMVELKYGLIA